jgi:hypothetical protein
MVNDLFTIAHLIHPQAFQWTHCKSKNEDNGRKKSWARSLATFQGSKGVLELRDGD